MEPCIHRREGGVQHKDIMGEEILRGVFDSLFSPLSLTRIHTHTLLCSCSSFTGAPKIRQEVKL